MTLRTATLKGQKPRNFKTKHKDLIERAELLSSAPDPEPVKLFQCREDDAWRREIGRDLMEWADKEDSYVLDAFALSRRISPKNFYKMRLKNDYFSQCLDYAKSRLGERLQLRLLKSKIEGSQEYMIKQLPKLDALWIEEREERLKAIEQQVAHVAYYAPTWKIDDKGEKVEVIKPPVSSV